jgi:3-deoxy-manno-octulosonate cytidylyltransferase (CMP-KDO synthetase)
MKGLGIIPARYGSTRFPGKPLVEINGKSMIRRVIDQAKKCTSLSEVWVATDDERIFSHVEEYGCKAIYTSENCNSGTERICELLPHFENDFDFVLNIQGDEPFVHVESLEELATALTSSQRDIATLAVQIESTEEANDSNRVKVVFSNSGRALYFSRSIIPFARNGQPNYFKHLGVYAYTTKALQMIQTLQASHLELTESLEQLRWIENDLTISIVVTSHDSTGIDTPEDLLKYQS